MGDLELLGQYTKRQSEAAFTALVERYASLVYSTAMRQARNPHLAEEVTQAVFIILARKAHTLRRGVCLSGWLYRAARFAASDAPKSQYRRQQREQEAAQMQTHSANEPAWEQLAPFLDEAMSRLAEKERHVVLLRFFENRSLAEVAAALGVTPDSARMRVARALEKLRSFLTRRGVALSAAALGGMLSANAVLAAPTGLASSAATVALLKGTTATLSTLALVKGTLKMMAWMKIKIGAYVGTGLLVGAAAVALLKGTSDHAGTLGRSDAAASGYRAIGVLKCTFFNSDGSVFTNQLLQFEIKVDGRKWQLTNFQTDGKRWIRGSDGSSIYHVFKADAPNDSAMVEPGPMPWGGYPSALVWLALGSGEYLQDSKSMFAPWADPYFEARVLAYEAAITPCDQSPHLPQTVDFVGSARRILDYPKSRYIEREGVSATARQEAIERISQVPAGFLGGHYHVLAFTNVGGALIPQRFQLVTYRGTVAGNSRIGSTYEGQVTQLERFSLESGLPDISDKPVSVGDVRFRDNRRPLDAIQYSLTNQWITDVNDARLVALKAARLESLP